MDVILYTLFIGLILFSLIPSLILKNISKTQTLSYIMFWYSFDDAGVLLETERSVFLNHIVLCIFSGILPDLLFQDIQRVEIRWCPFHLSQKQTNRLFKCSFVCYPHVCRIRLYYAISLNRIHNCRESHIFPEIQNIILKRKWQYYMKISAFSCIFQ